MTHVAVTGASSGIGAAMVREFAAAGSAITMVARRRPLMEKLAAEIGPAKTQIFTADLADLDRCTAWVASAEAAFGPIDVLVNNAGIMRVARATDIPIEDYEALLRLDLLAPLRLTRAVLSGMLARRDGTIVDVASIAALAPAPGMSYYAAAKAGLAAASEVLRAELDRARSGVNVVTVYPGPVHTELGESGWAQYERSLVLRLIYWGTADVLARKVRRAVERRRPRVIYPSVYRVARHFPVLVRWLMERFTPTLRNTFPPSEEA